MTSSPAGRANHAAWVAEREVGTPERLVRRAQEALTSLQDGERLPVAEALIHAAELLLRRMVEAEEDARDAALDLLAADACVTWAFEAAADAPESISPRAVEAMRRINELAGSPRRDG